MLVRANVAYLVANSPHAYERLSILLKRQVVIRADAIQLIGVIERGLP